MRTITRRTMSVSAACVAAATLVLVQVGPAGAVEAPKRVYFTSNATSITANITAGNTSPQTCQIQEGGVPLGPFSPVIAAGMSGTAVTGPPAPPLSSGKHNVELLCTDGMAPAAPVKNETVSVPPGPMDQFRDMLEGLGS
ncbi:hypothetical protein [Rhodococcus sp. NPDC127528]|uniref:hypothetical protein n=1 Tax=unclassified Rhodococcus (in: high G+C Gram-positive bacteria) TaxID=192944 RepID=UPI0036307BDB